ncbi:24cdb28b-fdde-462c-b0a5-5f1faf7bd1d2 [Thermothielavioides terrestris]|uniref:24cdb28b-fdde-462c-b0a5-5f1faf7bd1d2 n=1 Tax=Thermothielavioides terrestris TaxID=2587410 RepID=A0A3S4AVG0_9PEZI|nr:24cdb28b-fdde-462c-b0a5-5f1faf7bd1d2 [Thermothielavioides terrestris]
MAEVLGVVASGIAVAQAAQSLGGAVVALARLWREVRDVPDAVRAVLDELELAGEVVAAIESELTAAAAAAGAAGVSESGVSALHARVVQRCRAAREELGALVRDLAADITSSRRRKRVLAGVRVALKKDVLEAYEKRLRRALRMLDSVVQLHLASALRRQPELVAAEVTKVLALRGPSKMAAGVPPSDERQVEADAYRLRLSPPQWLLKKAWDLQISMAYSGWKTCFRQYVVVPNDSEIWDVFRRSESEFDELLRLFNNGLASPFSMDTHGHTLLHWAISFRPEFIEPLLRIGLDFYANPRNALDAYLLTENYYGPKAVLIHQAMLSHGVYDEADADTSWWAILRMLGNPQVFDSMLANVFPDLYQWPLDSRLSRLSEIVIVRDTNIRLIGRFLHPDGRFRLSDLRRRVPWYSQLFRPTHTVFDMLAAIYFKKSYDAQWRQTTYDRDMIDLWNETRIAFRDIAATADYCDLCSVRSSWVDDVDDDFEDRWW